MIELRRYTNLASALRILQTKKITLLSSDTWDDINDKRLIETYKEKKGFKSVLCLCFAEAEETYHHWKVFASGSDGICLVFDKEHFFNSLDKKVVHRKVEYYSVKDLNEKQPELNDLPFAKRSAYQPENEYRILWTSDTEDVHYKEFTFSSDAIARIIINPWVPSTLVNAITAAIHSLPDFKCLKVAHSKVIDGPAWQRLAESFE